MNNKHYLILLCLGGMIALVPFLVWLNERYNEGYFSCTSSVTLIRDDNTLNVDLHYSFSDGSGVVETSGAISSPDGSKVEIARKFNFSYERDGHDYIFISEKGYKKPLDTPLFNPVIPDFYLLSNRGLSVKIYKQKPGGYVFVTNNIPLFYCKKD